MAGASGVSLAVVLGVASYAILYSGTLDAALLLIFSIFRQWHSFSDFVGPSFFQQVAKITAATLITAALASWALRVVQTKDEIPQWDGPGKVLLFPGRTTHSRFFPKKHSFSYSYLVVGIPVDWEGTAGGMVSVGVKNKIGLASWFPLGPRARTGWYTVDAADYLERGNGELGLRGKLDAYLRTQVQIVLLGALC